MSKHVKPLQRAEIVSVIEGKGCASRVPNMVQFWVHPENFGASTPEVNEILDRYPCDVQRINLKIPAMYKAPADDPEFCWVNFDEPAKSVEAGHDDRVVISDWGQLDGVLAHFPKANYPGITQNNPPDDGRYRLGTWWFCFFERHWSLRGMTNALMDFYTDPEHVHRLYGALCGFYCGVMDHARKDMRIDGFFMSDDLGTQTGPFFSPEIFNEFFRPYYKRLFEHAHKRGLHFWLHCCGNIIPFIPRFIEIGLDVLHPIQKYTMDEKVVARDFGKDICIWAGFDVQQIIPWGTPDQVRAEARYLIDTFFRPEGRLMLTAGNGVNQDCPLASLEALLSENVRYGAEIVRRKRRVGS